MFLIGKESILSRIETCLYKAIYKFNVISIELPIGYKYKFLINVFTKILHSL